MDFNQYTHQLQLILHVCLTERLHWIQIAKICVLNNRFRSNVPCAAVFGPTTNVCNANFRFKWTRQQTDI